MNLFIRLLWVIFRAYKRNLITPENLQNEISTIVMPNDLDLNLHMNNGRYMTFCDFNRVDLFVRSGLAKLMFKNGWAPIVAHHTMSYLKPLAIFDRVKVTMEITHWDERYFYSNHVLYKRGNKIAEGTSKSLVISKKEGRLAPSDIVEHVKAYQGI